MRFRQQTNTVLLTMAKLRCLLFVKKTPLLICTPKVCPTFGVHIIPKQSNIFLSKLWGSLHIGASFVNRFSLSLQTVHHAGEQGRAVRGGKHETESTVDDKVAIYLFLRRRARAGVRHLSDGGAFDARFVHVQLRDVPDARAVRPAFGHILFADRARDIAFMLVEQI